MIYNHSISNSEVAGQGLSSPLLFCFILFSFSEGEKIMSNVPKMFGSLVFNETVMKDRLPTATYKTFKNAVLKGEALDLPIANIIANAMKDWALEHGATHFTHWFQPMTGITAEKHESFIAPTADGRVIMDFSGKELIQGEPDASSFPSGGLRATFEARGYTAWDPTSYAFIKDGCLCIPTAFCSYTGEVLDKKAPLLRSMCCVDQAARRILALFGQTTEKVVTTVGPEQEYFLVDKEMWEQRKDLVYTGRTLFGARVPKGQEMEDHYFGIIKPRVLAFMKELDEELWKLGVLAKTEHNEVAPAQHELAPIFTTTNVASDHNQLTMEFMKRVALRHGLVCLLHEKPFAGVNGSGKHNNWSLGTDTGIPLLAPAKTPEGNLQFVTFLVNVIMAVYKHNALLKASISSATNAHRLGANEAPPAIISIFLGSQMSDVLDALENSSDDAVIELCDKTGVKLNISQIPELLMDNTDRNRTSPFAFTGNRFEFRAVGSSANCAAAMIVLNSAVAHQLRLFKEEVDKKIQVGESKEKAIIRVLKKYIKESKPIRFDGNGYSDEWKAEAAARGLDCETSTPVIFDAYIKPASVEMFSAVGVMNAVELAARNEVKWEMYTKKIQIEARVMGDLALNHILPVATRYQALLLDTVCKIKEVFPPEEAAAMSSKDMEIIRKIARHTLSIQEMVATMVNARKLANKIEGERAKAIAYHDTVAPMLDEIRYHIDKLELMVDNQMWPLPKYREMLFVR